MRDQRTDQAPTQSEQKMTYTTRERIQMLVHEAGLTTDNLNGANLTDGVASLEVNSFGGWVMQSRSYIATGPDLETLRRELLR